MHVILELVSRQLVASSVIFSEPGTCFRGTQRTYWVVDVMSGSTVTDATKVRWEIVLRLAARNVRTLYANISTSVQTALSYAFRLRKK